jgi:AcrR family transcriptional regulator
VFARRGFNRANVDDLCREAGIARGTIYRYFDDKRDVMVALMDDIAARIEHLLDTRPPIESPRAVPGKSPLEVIVHFTRKRLRQVLDAIFLDEQTLRLILREARGLDGVVDDAIVKIDRMILKAMESDIRAAQNARLIRRGSPRLMARYLLGGVEKMVLSSLSDDEPIDLGAIVDVAVELELFGILSEEVRR